MKKRENILQGERVKAFRFKEEVFVWFDLELCILFSLMGGLGLGDISGDILKIESGDSLEEGSFGFHSSGAP